MMKNKAFNHMESDRDIIWVCVCVCISVSENETLENNRQFSVCSNKKKISPQII